MNIVFEQVTPAPLAGVSALASDVWQTQCVFEAGRRYQLTAPSGKGKSTAIHLIYGLRRDYTGRLTLGDKDALTLMPPEWATLRQKTFSIVFQDLRLFLDLTAWENLQVKAALYPEAAPDVTLKPFREMAAELGVTHCLEKKCGVLSYGERQRIAILRALIQPFEWLLLDEPFSHLDAKNIETASRLITQACDNRSAGFILTSLSSDFALQVQQQRQL